MKNKTGSATVEGHWEVFMQRFVGTKGINTLCLFDRGRVFQAVMVTCAKALRQKCACQVQRVGSQCAWSRAGLGLAW
jgi:hypothetical protein